MTKTMCDVCGAELSVNGVTVRGMVKASYVNKTYHLCSAECTEKWVKWVNRVIRRDIQEEGKHGKVR
mgnify:FL=1